MSFNQNDYILYKLAKGKLRDLDRELDAAKLAREARKAQPGLMKIALNQGSRLVTAFVLKLEKGIRQRGSRGQLRGHGG
jgi:hypothetical protein